MDRSDREKLRVLLDYWMKHNIEHAGEFREWAEKARAIGEVEVHDELMAAVALLEKANEPLTRALGRLGAGR